MEEPIVKIELKNKGKIKSLTLTLISLMFLFFALFFLIVTSMIMNQFIGIKYEIYDLIYSGITVFLCIYLYFKTKDLVQ